jgi:hypothetical protein
MSFFNYFICALIIAGYLRGQEVDTETTNIDIFWQSVVWPYTLGLIIYDHYEK